ncbi:hypothetical protein [Leucobacter iarius]
MMSLHEQYVLAGERYMSLNDRVAALQREVFEDAWKDGGASSEVIPGSGYTHGGELEGDERGESYYFSVSRWHQAEREAKTLLTRVADNWSAKSWDVGRERSSYNGEERITTTTPEGYWFELAEQGSEISLTGFSPVYWGDELKISMAIGARRDAEREGGLAWYSDHPMVEGRMTLLPGVYRPFPAWDAVK